MHIELNLIKLIHTQTQVSNDYWVAGVCSVVLWFPFNQRLILACEIRCVVSEANALSEPLKHIKNQ